MKNLFTIALALGITSGSFADVVLPKVIGSKMVLQRGVEAPIWGWADQGEEVTVSFAGQVKKAMPDAAGKWTIKLDPLNASAESRAMTISGKNVVILEDILVGEVWLASGQSNMEWTFHQVAPEEQAFVAAEKSNTLVRVFHVDQHLTAGVPLDDTSGRWKGCTEILEPPMRSVSAVGFFFALKLQQALGVPVAIIDANWGGIRIEPFIADEGYEALGLPHHAGGRDVQTTVAHLEKIAATVDDAIRDVKQGRKPLLIIDENIYGGAANGAYNAMIAPVAPFAITGAIWYQGESNRGSMDYFQKLQALSAGWSKAFNVNEIPLYQVQIAPFGYNAGNADETMLCDTIWAAQFRGAAEIPGMGIVAIHDTNIDIRDIHPRHKRMVGERLAAQALKNQYDKDVVTAGPSFAGATLDGSTAIVSFTGLDQGLSTTDGKTPSWFELSADGEVFVMAEAVIEGDTVRVSAPAVPSPAFVRMGWKDIAIPNLNDKNGWPAFAFPAQPVETGLASLAE